MDINLDEIFDSIVFIEGLCRGSPERKLFRVVIPVLGSSSDRKVHVFRNGCDYTNVFQGKYFGVGNYKDLNIGFLCCRDFYDYSGKKNSSQDIRLYLLPYRVMTTITNGRSSFTYYWKEETE